MKRLRLARWTRTVQAQLFLWAVLPFTFIIIALAFTGVYGHQHEMRDFVAERDLALARLGAQTLRDGLAYGVVAADGTGLGEWLEPTFASHPQGVVQLVVDDHGKVLAHTDGELLGLDLSSDPRVMTALEMREGATIVMGTDGRPLLAAFSIVAETGWVILVEEPVEELVGPILRVSMLAPVVAIGAGFVSLLVLSFGWRTIVRPLQRLARGAEQVSWGDYSAVSAPVGGVQEVQDLQQGLLDMVDRIKGYEAGVKDYLGAVTSGQEQERARLAQELHDGPVQDIIALGQRIEFAQRSLARGETEQASAILEESRKTDHAAVEGLRRLISALRPVYLEDLGFIPALELLAEQAKQRTGLNVRFEQHGVVPRLDPSVELAAYRIAQEALNNAILHAHAQNVLISVTHDSDGLALSIVDDGAGFSVPERPDALTQAGHYGVVGMQERATGLGGSLSLKSTPGHGTRLTAKFPRQRAPE